jgi:predicted metalloprotease
MSFNEDARLDTSQVTGGRVRGGAVVGGGVGGLVILLVSLFLGIDPGSVTGGQDPFGTGQVSAAGEESQADFSQCRTGADANRDVTCRIIGTVNSVQDYWNDALPADVGRQYRAAQTVIYRGATQSACGTASNQTGPFYCPSDERIYIDASFFDLLTSRFGADDGALAQEYVVAHEYGHHVQQVLGILGRSREGSGADGGGVRVELMADCLAGVWANHASSTEDADGRPLLEPLTDADVRSALSAAAAVGDDTIQRSAGATVDPDTWTHGSSEQRQRWFLQGYRAGDATQCDTFATDAL